MKNILLTLSFILIVSCNTKSDLKSSSIEAGKSKVHSNNNFTNDFDGISHFIISEENVKKNENNQNFQDVYSNLEDKKIDLNKFENQLTILGFDKKDIPEAKINDIIKTVTNDLNLKYHEVACVPLYNDIFIFKKNKKPVAGLKICFHCGMNEAIGDLKSNFDTENTEHMSDYSILYQLLYNKEHSQY
ncbi:hypothetical protein GKZ90_0010590 [Flavobacterium sp. MC2016-06]|jgi:hypothetical protein|uniref:hypothetical protein n=1 Tax=Flavobacterium sp. MC2016-06 TaxID=2676308 RepID=UPI0012BA972E|nr:hypothetical protein [Flavobacterium sp. MC2016-06]MBU3858547.1 DUF863 family protein [Flavobacterium sp. MC2016-06]